MPFTKNKAATPIDVYKLVKKWVVNSKPWATSRLADTPPSAELDRLSAAVSALVSTSLLWSWLQSKTLANQSPIQSMDLASTVRSASELLKEVVTAPDVPAMLHLAASILEALPTAEVERINEVIHRLNGIAVEHRDMWPIYAEGFNRDATVLTPKDLSLFLWALADRPKQIAVLAPLGSGLMAGLADTPAKCRVKLVFPRRKKDLMSHGAEPPTRSLIPYESTATNHAFTYIHSKLRPFAGACRTLLVNASTDDILLCAEDEYARQHGIHWIEDVFKGDYEQILAIVPNRMMSIAQGPNKAAEVFHRCVQRGLRRVIELPTVIGRGSQRYCVMEFLPGKSVEKIEFVVIPEEDTASAPAGIGHVRRSLQLVLGPSHPSTDGISPNAQSAILTPSEVLVGSNKTNGVAHKQKKPLLKSFEPSRYVSGKLAQSVNPALGWGRVGDYFTVHRSQHLKAGSDQVVELVEISAGNIGIYGELRDLEVKSVLSEDKDTLQKNRLRQGDIILCIKGAVGKVALIEQEPEAVTVTNQSFVVLRPVGNPEGDFRIMQFIQNIFWWMRSDRFQEHLKSRIVTVGVPRVPVSDIHELPLPNGSNEMLAKERKKYLNWKGHVKAILALERKVASMRRAGWLG